MTEINKIQPIDEYVRDLLRYAKGKYKKHGLDIDLNNPTRGQRLEAALAISHEANGFYSMEIMVGRRVSSDELSLISMLTIQGISPQDPKKFYEGFAHQYWPKGE